MTETIRGRPAVPFIANDRQLHLTMLYDDDAEVIARILGNDDVNRELTLVPTPYTLEDAHSWLRFKANEQANFHQLDWSDEAAVSAALQDAIPFHAIRDNSGQMIGDIGIRRSMFELVQDGAEKGKFIKENASKAAGDATIEYTLGYYMDPSAQRGGVTTAAVTATLQLAREYMNARHVVIECRPTNKGSRSVARKNGFVLAKTAEQKWKDGMTCAVEEWRIDLGDAVVA